MHEYQYHDAVYSGPGSGTTSCYNKVQGKDKRSVGASSGLTGAVRLEQMGACSGPQSQRSCQGHLTQLKFPETVAKSRCIL